MLSTTRVPWALRLAALAVFLTGCTEKPAPPSIAVATSLPSASTAPSSAPTVSASAAAPKPSYPCPDGSKGEGTFKDPCDAKGPNRLMEVAWTGKMTDAGPTFRVTNKSKLDILYGSLDVYFYDKAGKQLEVTGGASAKPRPKQVCSGNIFGGPMKPAEKAVISFSCVKKEHVPDGAVAIEAETHIVGFPEASSGKTDTYWRNNDLVPDARPKGGIK